MSNGRAPAFCLLYSDRLRPVSRNQQCKYGGSVANVSRNRHECFQYGRTLSRQCLKACADTVELLDFVQDRLKGMGRPLSR